MRFLLSGGGTAGHIYPALTVAEELRASGRDEVEFVGTPTGLEADLVPRAGIPFHPLAAKGFDRSRPLSLFVAVGTIVASTFHALSLIRSLRPDVVVGFGGYVSLPLGLAAVLSRVPLVLHEQNSVPGLANKVLSRWAERVGVTYSQSVERLRRPDRIVVTGNPVRPAVLQSRRDDGRGMLGLRPDARVLLVFGGSRGARHLNEATVSLYQRLRDVGNVQVVHVTGANEVASVRAALADIAHEFGEDPATLDYRVYDYIHEMGQALAAADLIVARAGATSLAEITALGKPSVLVPYPYATDDHQTGNARSVVEAGAGVLVPDAELDSPRFGDEVVRLLSDEATRAKMSQAAARLGRPDAAATVASLARDAARG